MPPNRDAVGFHALNVTEYDQQLVEGQVALFLDPAPDPACHASQFTMPTTVTRLFGLRGSGGALRKYHVVHELDRNPELRRRRPMRVTFLDKINNSPTKFHRKWLASDTGGSMTPNICHGQRESQIRPDGNPESEWPQRALKAVGDAGSTDHGPKYISSSSRLRECRYLARNARLAWSSHHSISSQCRE